MPEVIAVVRDKRNGVTRGYLIDALARARDPQTQAVLRELVDDPDVGKEATFRLKRLNSSRAERRDR
jgi:hypothetical protein